MGCQSAQSTRHTLLMRPIAIAALLVVLLLPFIQISGYYRIESSGVTTQWNSSSLVLDPE